MYITERIARLIETRVILVCITYSMPRIVIGENINKAIQCSFVKAIRKLSNLSAAYALEEKRQI